MDMLTDNGVNYRLDPINKDIVLFLIGKDINLEIDFFQRNNVKKLVISKYHGFLDDNLDILRFFSTAEEIFIQDQYSDIEGVYFLTKLVKINIASCKKYINLEKFSLLQSAYVLWNKKMSDFSNCNNLKQLTIWSFNPRSRSFDAAIFPEGLLELELNFSNILNFEALNCKKLTKFEGHYLSKLDSLFGANKLFETLNEVVLSHCKKIRDYSILNTLINLKKLQLSNCADIENLKFMASMPKLAFFSFVGTKILDGDLSYCKKLKYTGFIDSKRYSFTMDEMKEINNANIL